MNNNTIKTYHQITVYGQTISLSNPEAHPQITVYGQTITLPKPVLTTTTTTAANNHQFVYTNLMMPVPPVLMTRTITSPEPMTTTTTTTTSGMAHSETEAHSGDKRIREDASSSEEDSNKRQKLDNQEVNIQNRVLNFSYSVVGKCLQDLENGRYEEVEARLNPNFLKRSRFQNNEKFELMRCLFRAYIGQGKYRQAEDLATGLPRRFNKGLTSTQKIEKYIMLSEACIKIGGYAFVDAKNHALEGLKILNITDEQREQFKSYLEEAKKGYAQFIEQRDEETIKL